MKKQILSFCFLAALSLTAAEQIQVTLNGDASGELRCPFPGGYTLHQKFSAKGPNRQFNFNNVSLSKPGMREFVVARIYDDTCPWQINSTYIGANHGDTCASSIICEKEHGLTEKDCGTTWTDPKGRRFHIMKIASPKVLWVLGDNYSKDPHIWGFGRPGKEILKDNTGRTITPAKTGVVQLYSPVRITRRVFLADGKKLPEKCQTKCSVFTVEEDYDIVATDAILKHVLANKGRQVPFNAPGLDAVLSQKIRYNFYPNGSCIVTHDVVFHRDAQFMSVGFIQAFQLNKGMYAKHLFYIPKCLPINLKGDIWDFAGRADFTRPVKGSLLLKPEHFENPKSMPERFIQYLLNGKNQPNLGFALGYSLIEGCTTPEEHLKGTKDALFIFSTHKTYPRALDGKKIPRIKAGSKFYCMAYRQYFSPEQGYYVNQQGKSHVLYADFHAPVKDKLIQLPAELKNKKMSIIEKSPTVSMVKTADSCKFTSTGKYGYAVLQFE